jgi:general nucleoside transport system permease protein
VALWLAAHGTGLPLDRWCLVLLAGVLGGMAWAALTALLRDRFNANEILVSLMLVYVAQQLSTTWSSALEGPAGLQLPADARPSTRRPAAAPVEGTRLHMGCVLAPAGGGGGVGVSCSAPSRLRAAGRRAGAGGGALRRLLVARALWTGAAGLGRPGGAGRRDGGGRARSASSRRTCPPATASPPSSCAFVGRLHPLGIVFSACC